MVLLPICTYTSKNCSTHSYISLILKQFFLCVLTFSRLVALFSPNFLAKHSYYNHITEIIFTSSNLSNINFKVQTTYSLFHLFFFLLTFFLFISVSSTINIEFRSGYKNSIINTVISIFL